MLNRTYELVFETKLSSFLTTDRCFAKKIKQAKFCCILNVDREVLFIEASLWALRKICFHPAKFDNFKDEKISDFKTVSVSQRKNLLD